MKREVWVYQLGRPHSCSVVLLWSSSRMSLEQNQDQNEKGVRGGKGRGEGLEEHLAGVGEE